jgi:RHS repeat-associated protein
LRVYTWNDQSQLLQVLNSQKDAVYRYDALGRRIGKIVAGITTEYVYDIMDVIRQTTHGSGSIDYLRGLAVDQVWAARRDGSIEVLSRDRLNSILSMIGPVGALSNFEYDEYGGTGNSKPTAVGFTGREHDENGIIYFRARYYDPILGVFLSEDPARFESGDINFYRYAYNSAPNLTDPFGLVWTEAEQDLAIALIVVPYVILSAAFPPVTPFVVTAVTTTNLGLSVAGAFVAAGAVIREHTNKKNGQIDWTAPSEGSAQQCPPIPFPHDREQRIEEPRVPYQQQEMPIGPNNQLPFFFPPW